MSDDYIPGMFSGGSTGTPVAPDHEPARTIRRNTAILCSVGALVK